MVLCLNKNAFVYKKNSCQAISDCAIHSHSSKHYEF